MTCQNNWKLRIAVKPLVSLLLATPVPAATPSPLPVSAPEAEAWIRHTVPLPKQIEMGTKVVLPAGSIRIVEAGGGGLVGAQAVAELSERLGGKARGGERAWVACVP